MAITQDQQDAIVSRCSKIRDSLKDVQKEDAKARVHLGERYEAVLNRFIVPLNVRLVEKNLSNASLVENQNDFVEAKTMFADDYIVYQRELEELVTLECKSNPSQFYEKLTKVRQKRKTMEQDVMRLRSLISQHVKLVKELMEKM